MSVDLAALEADIAAVGSALESIDRILAAVDAGEEATGSAAAEIAAVVSADRFAVDAQTARSSGDAQAPADP